MIANHVAVSISNAQLYGRMEQMATTDGLTGLSNHRTFQERVVEMLARAERSNGRLSLMLTDIDHFKKVNDTYGHPIGDVVLKGVAQVVRECVRKVDLAARYGGEEFAIVMPGSGPENSTPVAERIRQRIEAFRPTEIELADLRVTASIGMSVSSGGSARELIAYADQALYQAKEEGKNRLVTRIPPPRDQRRNS